MVTIGVAIGAVFILLGLVLSTDRMEAWYRSRRKQERFVEHHWLPPGADVCQGCRTWDYDRDFWLPYLCYECAELVRVKARNKHYEAALNG